MIIFINTRDQFFIKIGQNPIYETRINMRIDEANYKD